MDTFIYMKQPNLLENMLKRTIPTFLKMFETCLSNQIGYRTSRHEPRCDKLQYLCLHWRYENDNSSNLREQHPIYVKQSSKWGFYPEKIIRSVQHWRSRRIESLSGIRESLWTFCQSTYFRDVLRKLRMENWNPVGTSLTDDQKLTKSSSNQFPTDTLSYREPVRTLTYVAVGTSPVITRVVSTFSWLIDVLPLAQFFC